MYMNPGWFTWGIYSSHRYVRKYQRVAVGGFSLSDLRIPKLKTAMWTASAPVTWRVLVIFFFPTRVGTVGFWWEVFVHPRKQKLTETPSPKTNMASWKIHQIWQMYYLTMLKIIGDFPANRHVGFSGTGKVLGGWVQERLRGIALFSMYWLVHTDFLKRMGFDHPKRAQQHWPSRSLEKFPKWPVFGSCF